MPELRCPCGGLARECVCECGPCVESREAVALQEHAYCSRCDRSMPVSSFGTRASGTRQSWCRTCSASYARERRQAVRTAAPVPRTAARRSRATSASPYDRPFGLEIEIIHADMYTIERALNTAGISAQVEGYNHTTRAHWKIVPDGSLSRGFEVVSPILRGAEGRRTARQVFEILREAGATVDRSCGLHVHHDASDLSAAAIARLVRSWRGEQDLIDGLVAPSRRRDGGSGWCHPLDDRDVRDADAMAQYLGDSCVSRSRAAQYLGDGRDHMRYRTLNFRAYSLHGTIEVRQHQGTLNATKALSWVLFAQAMFARAAAATNYGTHRTAIRDLLTDLEAVGLEPTTASYLADRWDAFSGQRIAA